MVYRIDLFAIFIFLGIVQAFFLSLFFFSKENRQIKANLFQGLMVLSVAACSFEILLCYTGYIIDALWLVDYSEALSFVIGPSFLLMIICLIQGQPGKRWYLHFVPAVIWLFLQFPFLIQGDDVKFNAWIGSYHTAGLSFRHVDVDVFSPPHHSEIILAHLTTYVIIGIAITVKAFRDKKQLFWRTEQTTFKKLRASAIQIALVVMIIIVVKLLHRDDMGDHLFAAYMSVPIYLISFQMISQSGFFKQPSLAEQQKYKTSSLTSDQQQILLNRLRLLMSEQKPFLKPDFSLPELADQMKISVHQLSQVINDGLGKSFFEMTAEHRIEEAKHLLKEKPNIKVEEIAEEVGYNSKSSFNTAFKKLTGKTPSEWRG
ncbi:MAG TPA: hypothetical protein DGG95_11740 [Cytophagales bacterium]|jgi:AraC-like DNA-binding protein|nr:hypothetical protein [Cytophagales bacterium]